MSFIVNAFFSLVNLNVLNRTGYLIPVVSFLSILMNTLSKTLARVLMIIVCLGSSFSGQFIRSLGVSKNQLDSYLWRVIAMGVIFFVVTLWDSLSSSLISPVSISFFHIIPSSMWEHLLSITISVDSLFYFWILQSLMDTVQELEEKRQTSKLEVFRQLRIVVWSSAFFAVLYNVLFSYVLLEKVIERFWKYQWLWGFWREVTQ